MPSQPPSGFVLDAAADERPQPDLIERLRATPTTRVLAVRGDRAQLRGGALVWRAPADVAEAAEWGFLGRDEDGDAVLVAALPPIAGVIADETGAAGWESLRMSAGDLAPTEAAAFVTAVALARWFADFGFCPRCGAPALLRQSGWSRRCTGCGREQFPRTDPAIIVAVRDAADEHILLGQNASWAAAGRFSTFAGFVEAGESLESAVSRELLEEAGVQVADATYRSSQAWPYPRSLMLGFHATAVDPAAARPDGEEIVAVRWFSRAEIADALAGTGPVALPGSASIARRLIRDWCEGGA
ncbi:NAD(+) diphosphatase [Microbacterium radiodurans]|uniref:NAD(+) diphosphatase n=1 Tax=Microbacterium radiodurans TaxID=661398 RepID=A0A5J5IQ05_9MICO|nr:NAD(+) diphosphatase [Microbacterium radiodurans]KAA9086696.1 NAD(+) diphosphatase [Microbacterium radiodurans]